MTNKYRDAKHALWSVSEEIYDYAYDYYSLPSEWDGADVFVTAEPLAIDANSDAGRLTIVTSAAPQIAWLLGRLRDAFANLGDGGLESTIICDLPAPPERMNSVPIASTN
jgi:hypothetical protein